jgi:hypothetical protein
MTIRMTTDRLSGADYEYLRRRQQQLIKDHLTPTPAPASRRAKNRQPVTREQIEQLRLALLNAFKW